jgi:hypothetical protein
LHWKDLDLKWPEIPHPRELGAWLRKMEANPGSCVILTIEPRKDEARPDVRVAWISEAERKKIRAALIKVNIARGLQQQPLLTDDP